MKNSALASCTRILGLLKALACCRTSDNEWKKAHVPRALIKRVQLLSVSLIPRCVEFKVNFNWCGFKLGGETALIFFFGDNSLVDWEIAVATVSVTQSGCSFGAMRQPDSEIDSRMRTVRCSLDLMALFQVVTVLVLPISFASGPFVGSIQGIFFGGRGGLIIL